MSRISSLLKKKLMMRLIDCKVLNKKRIKIKDRGVLFTDIAKSNLLREIAFGGYKAFEGEVVTLVEKYPWHIDRFIDTGANIGFYSILASITFEGSVEIIAVEPFPANVEYIKKIKKINNLDFKLIGKALDRAGGKEVTMYYPTARNSSKFSSSASLINSFKGTGGIYNNLPYKTMTVETITLEDVVGGDSSNTLIKLDCEGSESDILEASPSVLKRRNIDFIMEITLNDKEKGKIYNLMRRYGYDAYLITNAGFVREDRPLTLPYLDESNRYRNYTGTLWKSHFFTKRRPAEIEKASLTLYGFYI
ncbi:MAG: FkbM family methyltransferase [Candidatus Omnitrophica bacterium]|nr:FkbM family methyltransferase [Candidatus Omnitrophota bacterium]